MDGGSALYVDPGSSRAVWHPYGCDVPLAYKVRPMTEQESNACQAANGGARLDFMLRLICERHSGRLQASGLPGPARVDIVGHVEASPYIHGATIEKLLVPRRFRRRGVGRLLAHVATTTLLQGRDVDTVTAIAKSDEEHSEYRRWLRSLGFAVSAVVRHPSTLNSDAYVYYRDGGPIPAAD